MMSDDYDNSETEVQIKPKPRHYYVVSFATKKTTKYYVGQLSDELTDPSENTYNFSFLRYSRKTANHFVWPECEDEAVAPLEDIVRELSMPKRARHGGGLISGSRNCPIYEMDAINLKHLDTSSLTSVVHYQSLVAVSSVVTLLMYLGIRRP